MNRSEWDPILLDPPGVVGDVVRWIRESSGMYQPKFALAAGLTVCAALVGRAVKDSTGQRTNLYTLSVGRTSAGKNAPLTMVHRLVDALGQNKLIVGKPCSESAIEALLSDFPVRLFLMDEIGHYLATLQTAGRGDVNLRSVMPALMDGWSCANSAFLGKARAKDSNGRYSPPRRIREPCVCLYGATTPEVLFSGMRSADLADGSMPRFLTFVSLERPKYAEKPEPVVPLEVLEGVRRVLSAFGVKRHGFKNQAGKIDDEPTARLVPTGRVAGVCFRDFADCVYEKMLQSDKGDKVLPLWGKAVENARRVALTVAAFRDPSRPVVDLQDAEYAVGLVKQLVGDMVRHVRECVADTGAEKVKKRLLAIIRGAGAAGILKSELTRKTQDLRPAERAEALEDLEESGEVCGFHVAGRGAKESTKYVLTDRALRDCE